MTHSPADLIRAAEVTAAQPDTVTALTHLLRDTCTRAQITALHTLPPGPARDAYEQTLHDLITQTYGLSRDLSAAVTEHLRGASDAPPSPAPADEPAPAENPVAADPASGDPAHERAEPHAAAIPDVPCPVIQPTTRAAPTTWPDRLAERVQALTGDPSPARLALLALALRAAGQEHLSGHLTGRRDVRDITNPQGVHMGLLALHGYSRRDALSRLHAALAPHHAAHFTPEQLAVTCAAAELTAAHLRDLHAGHDPRSVPTAALLAATQLLAGPPRAPRATPDAQQAFTALTGTLRAGGLPRSEVLVSLTPAQRDTFKRVGTADPPSGADLAALRGHLEQQYQQVLRAGTRRHALHRRVADLNRDFHLLPQALLEHARLLSPDLPDSAVDSLNPVPTGEPITEAHLSALEDVLTLLTDDDCRSLQARSYALLAQTNNTSHPIAAALIQQVQAHLSHLPVWYDLTLTRQGVTPDTLRTLRAGGDVHLSGVLTLRAPLEQLLGEYDARADRRAQFLPRGTTPVTQYLVIHVRRLGGLSVRDTMDLLHCDEDAARTALTGLRLTRTDDGRYVQAS